MGAVAAQRQVGRGGRGLPGVGGPRAPAAPGGREAPLAHEPPHDLLRDAPAAPPELGVDGAVAPAAHGAEQGLDLVAQRGVLVAAEPGAVVLIGAPC